MRLVPSPDEASHEDNVLMAAIANVNNQLGRYVLRFLDADAGCTEPLSPYDERALADSVEAIADGLRDRAARRERGSAAPALLCCGTNADKRGDDA
jgi:hypothetical protein